MRLESGHGGLMDVLGEALELTDGERRSFLARACEGNARLRAKLDALLAEESALTDGFLEIPAVLEFLGEI